MMKSENHSALIVDDDQSTCNFIGEILMERGYTCDMALNGHDALQQFQNHYYDIALLDIRLPDTSGIELLEVLQSSMRDMPIIMITAISDLDTVIKTMKLGASDYIIKPFTVDKLVNSISAAVENNGHWKSDSTSTEITETTIRDTENCKQWEKTLNAIATGIDIQLEYYDFHSKIIINNTAKLARHLGIPEKEITEWEIMRNMLLNKRRMYIHSLEDKLKQNTLAQILLGQTNLIDMSERYLGGQN